MPALRPSLLIRWMVLPAGLILHWVASGCCIVDDFFPENKFLRDIEQLTPQAVSLHPQIPYLPPTGADTCGLSCLDMIFAYHRIQLPESAIAPLREKAAQQSGVSVNDIVGLLQQAGFKTLRRQGRFTWPALAKIKPWYKDINNPLSQIHFGRPVILHLKLPSGSEHFILLVGFDEPRRKYIIQNPGIGPAVLAAAKLEALWDAGGRIFIAYKPPDASRLPAPPAPPSSTPAAPRPAPALPATP